MKTAIVLVLLLSGCATLPAGVQMTEDERAACAESKDCTVWMLDELHQLANIAMQKGYRAGKKRQWELSL